MLKHEMIEQSQNNRSCSKYNNKEIREIISDNKTIRKWTEYLPFWVPVLSVQCPAKICRLTLWPSPFGFTICRPNTDVWWAMEVVLLYEQHLVLPYISSRFLLSKLHLQRQCICGDLCGNTYKSNFPIINTSSLVLNIK